jgi:hypothetical protein
LNISRDATCLDTSSCIVKISALGRSKLSAHNDIPSRTLSRFTFTLSRAPDRWTLPSSTASAFNSLAASSESISWLAYFRTALVGRTVNPPIWLTFVIIVSAIPNPR